MGIFFEQRRPDPRLIALLADAIQAPVPPNPDHEAAVRAGQLQPLLEPLRSALATRPPEQGADTIALADAKAAQVTNELLGGSSFNTGRFIVAAGIFAVLLIAAVWTDADNLKNSPTALYALATTVFGIVVGFLGAEKS
ncbi:MAG: hypothetical protein ACR2JH_04990 [Solirubrobacteraceae bacterium]